MTSGWGVDATLNGSGVPTSGTTDLDVRKIWGGLFTPGIISGCEISTSGSQLKYTIESGVVAIKTATGEIVMAPVTGQSITVDAVTSSRTDYIWVQQHYPTIEGDSNIEIGWGSSIPPRALKIGAFTIGSGATNTNAAVENEDRTYSIPYGASLGQLYYWQNQYNGTLSTSLLREGYGSFYVPTDRLITVSVSAVLSALTPSLVPATGFSETAYCEHGFLPSVDGGDIVLWSTGGLHQAWETFYFEKTIKVLEGRHNVNLGQLRLSGPGRVTQHYGTDGQGFGRNGAEFMIKDAGPAK